MKFFKRNEVTSLSGERTILSRQGTQLCGIIGLFDAEVSVYSQDYDLLGNR